MPSVSRCCFSAHVAIARGASTSRWAVRVNSMPHQIGEVYTLIQFTFTR